MSVLEQLRQLRIGPFAVFDFGGSYLAVYLLAPWISKLFLKIGVEISRVQLLWLTLPVGILVHILTSTETPLTKMDLDPNGHYGVKLLIVFMVVMAVRG